MSVMRMLSNDGCKMLRSRSTSHRRLWCSMQLKGNSKRTGSDSKQMIEAALGGNTTCVIRQPARRPKRTLAIFWSLGASIEAEQRPWNHFVVRDRLAIPNSTNQMCRRACHSNINSRVVIDFSIESEYLGILTNWREIINQTVLIIFDLQKRTRPPSHLHCIPKEQP